MGIGHIGVAGISETSGLDTTGDVDGLPGGIIEVRPVKIFGPSGRVSHPGDLPVPVEGLDIGSGWFKRISQRILHGSERHGICPCGKPVDAVHGRVFELGGQYL